MENTAGWSIEETKELFSKVEEYAATGSLNKAFKEIAASFNRKPNSVRNYYYSQLKAFSLVPDMAKRLGIAPRITKKQFETFSEQEVDQLVRHILIEQAKGKSVRSITTDLANGDKSLMLRYQNKYRSVIASKRGRVERIIEGLNKDKVTYRHPITNEIIVDGKCGEGKAQNVSDMLNELAEVLDAEVVKKLLELAIKGMG